MINSVASSGDRLAAYSLTQSTGSASSASNQAAASDQKPGWGTPAELGLGDLTDADWKLLSAVVGKNVGPDASGKMCGAVPLLAAGIEMERKSGYLSSGHELTVDDLKAMGANQPSTGYVDQVNKAIAYLEQKLQTSLGSSSGHAIDVTA